MNNEYRYELQSQRLSGTQLDYDLRVTYFSLQAQAERLSGALRGELSPDAPSDVVVEDWALLCYSSWSGEYDFSFDQKDAGWFCGTAAEQDILRVTGQAIERLGPFSRDERRYLRETYQRTIRPDDFIHQLQTKNGHDSFDREIVGADLISRWHRWLQGNPVAPTTPAELMATSDLFVTTLSHTLEGIASPEEDGVGPAPLA